MHLVREGTTLRATQNSRKGHWGERRDGFGCKEMQTVQVM